MYTKLVSKIILLLFVVQLAACQSAELTVLDRLSGGEELLVEPAVLDLNDALTDAPPISSAATVDAFYSWYLEYIGDPAGEFRNPLVDKAYQDSPYLSQDFIRQVDETIASFGNGGGFDPILMAQDIPSAIEVGVGSEEGIVFVRERFGDSWLELEVSLVQSEGRWLIDGIRRAEQ